MTRTRSIQLWPMIIVGLIVLFLGLTFWSIRQANQGVSAVTNDKYYSHGLRYNETQLEKQAAEALGWTMNSVLSGRQLVTGVTDKQGQSVPGLTLNAVIYPGKGEPIRQTLAATGDQTFILKIPANLSGQITIQLQANREGAGLSKTLLVNL